MDVNSVRMYAIGGSVREDEDGSIDEVCVTHTRVCGCTRLA
jgi:hypothetical protein